VHSRVILESKAAEMEEAKAAAMVEVDLEVVSKNENRDHMFPLPIVLCQSNPCPAVLLRVA